MRRGDPGARAAGARVGIGVAICLLLAARAAPADERKLPVPWPTSPDEVIPPAAPAAPSRPAAPPSPPSSSITVVPPAPSPSPPPAPSPSPSPTAGPERGGAETYPRTHVGALGDGMLFFNLDGTTDWDPSRLMARLTHSPTPWLRFHVEAGIENADSFAAQQALVELSPAPAFGFRAGLLLLPLGLINQKNAPTDYLTVDRPLTDRLIIPTIWRELGAGIYGEAAAGVRFELDVVSALGATGFAAQAPLAGGRGNGHRFGVLGPAVTGRLEFFSASTGFAMGGSGYYGSASGEQPALDGVRVGLIEGDLRLRAAGFDLRAEYAQVFIFNSYRVNDYLGLLGQDAIPKAGRGAYAQAGYDLLRLGSAETRQELLFFVGYEIVNPRSAMSAYNYNPPMITPPGERRPNDPSPDRAFVRAGFCYRPLPALVLKVDLQVALDGDGPAPSQPVTLDGAPGTPRPLDSELAVAARGKTRVGLGLGFAF